jgi:arginase family enzyme
VDAQVDSLAPGMNTLVGLPDDKRSSFRRGPLHLPLDMDLLDPALALGASHHEPGWFFTPDVIGLIQNLRAPTDGIDIVECAPKHDVQEDTATTVNPGTRSRSDQE